MIKLTGWKLLWVVNVIFGRIDFLSQTNEKVETGVKNGVVRSRRQNIRHNNVDKPEFTWKTPTKLKKLGQTEVKLRITEIALVGRYSDHLNTELVWYSNDRFVSGCQMVRYLNGGLKTGLKKACLWSKMSYIQMVSLVTWLYHLNTRKPYCLVFRWIQYSGVRYSDDYCIEFWAFK